MLTCVWVDRYRDILPYDDTRVRLRRSADNSDYINANYVTFPNEDDPLLFIASQGPTTQTVDDHWTMVWEQHVAVIVMVANLSEGGKSKCAA